MTQQYHLPLPQRDAMTADDFLVTASNREAAGWIMARDASTWPAHCLILYGTEGSGKTHLLSIWQEKYNARPLRAGEDIMDEIQGGCALYKGLAFDDADRIAGNAAHEEWMQHVYNATQAARLPLLLTAEKAPAEWGLKLKDIESRLKSCPAIELKQPDDELMRGMLLKLFSDRQLLVEEDVIEYLSRHLERSGRTLLEAVDLLDKKALEKKRKITVPFVQEALSQVL